MTDNELKLLKLIHENDKPEEAIVTAVNIILSFLEQHESYQVSSVDCFQGQA